jgi:hypothetical protein
VRCVAIQSGKQAILAIAPEDNSMNDVRIIEVDEALHAQTDMRPGTRMVQVAVPTDRPVTVHAAVNARKLQQCRIWDAAGHMHFEWEGRGEHRTIGAGSRTFEHTPLNVACMALQTDHWVVSDLNVCAESEEGERRVVINCEDGGDFPGSWDDLILRFSWTED